jgi:hypothetical protein
MQRTPICSGCGLAMKPEMNGVLVIETAHAPPQAYKTWWADEWRCPMCRHKVIVGFSEISQRPNAENMTWAVEHPFRVRLWNKTPQAVDLGDILTRWATQGAE